MLAASVAIRLATNPPQLLAGASNRCASFQPPGRVLSPGSSRPGVRPSVTTHAEATGRCHHREVTTQDPNDPAPDDALQFRSDAQTEARLRAQVFPELAELTASLPAQPPPAATSDQERNVYAVAHGLYCRVARTAQAALLLVDAGYGSEVAPLRRSLLEHAVAIAWVRDEGSAAVDSLTRVHKNRMKSIRDLMSDRWNLTAENFAKLLEFEVPNQGQDHLTKFGQLVQRYEIRDDLLIAWLADTGMSHPSFLTARAYWHDGGTRLAITPDPEEPNDVSAIGFLWWLAASQFESFTEWGDRLAEVGRPVGLPPLRLTRESSI